MYGWVGKILRVDLTTGKLTETPTSDYTKFIGARGIGAMIYWEEVPPTCKAFDPENALIFMTGPAAGTMAPSAGKFSISTKSAVPDTECYNLSVPGGHFAPELKFAGYDGIVVKGKSPRPVYLWINDGKAELRSAERLWGKTLTDMTEDLYSIHGPQARILGIGPAGENLLREAAVIVDHEHATGISGCGAVMGSKNLKAIAVLGTGAVNVAKPKDMMDLWWTYFRLVNRKPGEAEPQIMHKSMYDGLFHFPHMPHSPGHPQAGTISNADYFKNFGLDSPINLMADAVKAGTIKLKWGGCYGCAVNCALSWQSNNVDIPSGSGQCNDWMSWAAWEWKAYKKVCGIPAIQFDAYIDDMGLSKTNALGYHFYYFLEDLVNLGIITKENTGLPLDQPWTLDFIKTVLEKFAHREGPFAKDGVLGMAPEGQNRFLKYLAEKYPQAKSLYEAIIVHPGYYTHWNDLRGIPDPNNTKVKTGIGHIVGPGAGALSAAVEVRTWMVRVSTSNLSRPGLSAPNTAAKLQNDLYFGGLPDALTAKTWKDKVPIAIIQQNAATMVDCLTMCGWSSPPIYSSQYTPDKLGDPAIGEKIFTAATGVSITHDEMMAAMDANLNIERCIHVREGRRRADDIWNEFTFKTDAWNWTTRDEFGKAMDEFYTARGWDPKTGIPRRATLEKLGLKKVADELESKYKVSVPA